jgi:hypothetical protein
VKKAHTASIQANICRLEREISSIQNIMSSLKIRCSMNIGCSCNYCKLPLENQQEPNFCQQRGTFSKFMSLPYELRLRIWELADAIFQAPRVVEVRSRKDPAGAKYDEEGRVMCRISSSNGPPKGLRICYETRKLVLPHLIIFGTARFYLNPSIDTLYFGPDVAWGQAHHFPLSTEGEHLRAIRHLAFEETLLAPFMLAICASPHTLNVLEGLETISITLSGGGHWSIHHEHWRTEINKSGKHCDKCGSAQCMVGTDHAWKFPTYQEFAAARQLSGNGAEHAYCRVLSGWEGRWSLFAWLWDFIHEGPWIELEDSS